MHLVDADKNKRKHNLALLGEAGALRACSTFLWAGQRTHGKWQERDTVPKESSCAVVLGRRRKGFSCVLDVCGYGVLPTELSSSLYCCKELLHPSCRTSHLSLSNVMRFLLVPSYGCSGLSEWHSALARVNCSPLVSLVSAVGLMKVHTVSTFTWPTKILNCPNRSLRNSAYKSLQVEYEPFKLKKQGGLSPTY